MDLSVFSGNQHATVGLRGAEPLARGRVVLWEGATASPGQSKHLLEHRELPPGLGAASSSQRGSTLSSKVCPSILPHSWSPHMVAAPLHHQESTAPLAGWRGDASSLLTL